MLIRSFLASLFLCMGLQAENLLLAQAENARCEGNRIPFAELKAFLPSNPVIVEAGAQFGEDSEWMSELWPEGRIYAFEPSPESFPSLQKVAEACPNVVPCQLGLSDCAGEFPFYLCGGASSLLCPSAGFNRDYFHADLSQPIKVSTITLDEWCQTHDVNHIDFLWFDMEGNELRALNGALSIIDKVKCIYIEVNLQSFWEGCARHEGVKKWMQQHQFVEVWSDIVPHWRGNVLYVKGDASSKMSSMN
jgi:FkbM family methyltransferase